MKTLLMSWLILLAVVVVPVRAQVDDALPALVQLIGQSEDPQFQLDLLKGMREGLKGRRQVAKPEGWDAVARKLSQSPSEEVRSLVQALSLVFGSNTAMANLRTRLSDPTAPVEDRRKALASLLAAKDPQLPPLLLRLLKDPAMRAEALRALAAFDTPATPDAILAVYPELNGSERRDALNTLASRASYAQALLRGIESGTIPPRDLTAGIVRQLRQFKDPAITEAVTRLWGMTRETPADKQAQIARYKAMVEAGPPGHPSRGRAVYARTCQQCHTLFGEGGRVGPDITGSNRADLDYILHNIIDPNAEIPNDYRTSTVETVDDRVITGIITDQTDNALTVATANDVVLVPRSEVQSVQQGELSMMPEGLIEALTDREIRDLVAYLKSPEQVPLAATEDTLETFFDGQTLRGWQGDTNLWRVEKGEIIGTSPGLPQNEWLSGPLWLGDFRFICQVRLRPNQGNSGIQFRSRRLASGEVMGYQADIGAGWWGKLYEEHGRGLLWDKPAGEHVRKEQWNTYEILARGHRIQTAVNGRPCVDLDDPKGRAEGIIAFQLHSGGPMEVRFRNLRLELNPSGGLRTVTR